MLIVAVCLSSVAGSRWPTDTQETQLCGVNMAYLSMEGAKGTLTVTSGHCGPLVSSSMVYIFKVVFLM